MASSHATRVDVVSTCMDRIKVLESKRFSMKEAAQLFFQLALVYSPSSSCILSCNSSTKSCSIAIPPTYTSIIAHIPTLPSNKSQNLAIMSEWPERDIDKIAKGWSIAMRCSKERLKRVYGLETQQLDDAVNQGRVVLETVCVFMHACVKRGQYK